MAERRADGAGQGGEAVIVAHGSPSDPGAQEAALMALAAEVGALLPGWTVRGATLAAERSLQAALAGLAAPLVYPFFMAEGWFTRRALPARLDGRGVQLPPFGVDPALPALAATAALDGAWTAGIAPQEATLLLAAHGSQVSTTSKDSTLAMAARLAALTPFAEVRAGFVEQAPFLAEAARGRRGLCLPFFALRAGHVASDVPEALAEAGFEGALLPAIGEHPGVPALIARALAAAAATAAAGSL
jgi:sirohydrochlorin ferrochelatase